jgi:hypothetical protein
VEYSASGARLSKTVWRLTRALQGWWRVLSDEWRCAKDRTRERAHNLQNGKNPEDVYLIPRALEEPRAPATKLARHSSLTRLVRAAPRLRYSHGSATHCERQCLTCCVPPPPPLQYQLHTKNYGIS